MRIRLKWEINDSDNERFRMEGSLLESKSNIAQAPRSTRTNLNHPTKLILGDITLGVTTRSQLIGEGSQVAIISQLKPKNIKEAL